MHTNGENYRDFSKLKKKIFRVFKVFGLFVSRIISSMLIT